MPDIYFKSVPFSKEDVTLALESGVDGIITEAEHVEGVRSLALCDVRAEADMPSVGLGSKAEEESIASCLPGGGPDLTRFRRSEPDSCRKYSIRQ